jgi:hypothetical protein
MASFSQPQVEQIPKLQEGQGYDFTVNGKVYLGFGQFNPEGEYQKIPETLETRRYRSMLPSTVTTLRNSVFAYIPSENKILYFSNKVEYPEEIPDLKQYKAFKALEKIIKFRLFKDGVYAYFIFLDQPDKTPAQSVDDYFHQDTAGTATLNEIARQALQYARLTHSETDFFNPNTNMNTYAPALSDYTFIEYRRDCISTTVKNPYINNEIIRFWACPGSVLCVDNISTTHSSPFVHETVPGDRESAFVPNREAGNEFMINKQKEGISRPLHRTQLHYATQLQVQQIIAYIYHHAGEEANNIVQFMDLLPEYAAELSRMQPFESISLEEYTYSQMKPQEAGRVLKKGKNIKKNKKNKKYNNTKKHKK